MKSPTSSPPSRVPRDVICSVTTFTSKIILLVPAAAAAVSAVLRETTTRRMLDRLYFDVVFDHLVAPTDDELVDLDYARVLWFRFVSVLPLSHYRKTAISRRADLDRPPSSSQ